MMELKIYPEHWNRTVAGNDRPLHGLLDGYDELCAFVARSVEKRAGAVVYVS